MEINDIEWNINEFNTVMNRITLMSKLLNWTPVNSLPYEWDPS